VPPERATACEAPAPPGRRSRNPHQGAFVSVYVNQKGRDTYLASDAQASGNRIAQTQSKTFAPGTVIVKEKLRGKDDQHPSGLGVMIKRAPGYDAKSGDWQFLYVDAEDELTSAREKLTGCIDCHSNQTETDFTFGQPTKASGANEAGY
jgi:hypothetical protein